MEHNLDRRRISGLSLETIGGFPELRPERDARQETQTSRIAQLGDDGAKEDRLVENVRAQRES